MDHRHSAVARPENTTVALRAFLLGVGTSSLNTNGDAGPGSPFASDLPLAHSGFVDVNRLCGTTRASSRVNALAALSSSIAVMPASSTTERTPFEPPLNASSGCSLNGARISGSVVRMLRTGPIRSASSQLNSTTKRVMPPSTTSS